MTDFNEQKTIIRQFLLGQLSEEKSEQMEARIFADPDFAEEVQIVEDELITDYGAGTLNPEARGSFERKYSTPANHSAVEFEGVLTKFICSKWQSEKPSANANLEPKQVELRPAENASPLALATQPKRERRGSWLYSVFDIHPALAYSTIVASLVLIAITLSYIGHQLNRPGNDLLTQRQVIEADLARLNTTSSASPEKVLSIVELQSPERDKGAMARIATGNASPDTLIEFRLNPTRANAQSYSAIFLDDRRNELFAISNLTAESTPSGPQVRLFVPIKYLKRGDYQIDLSASNNNGRNEQINSYAFRVLETK